MKRNNTHKPKASHMRILHVSSVIIIIICLIATLVLAFFLVKGDKPTAAKEIKPCERDTEGDIIELEGELEQDKQEPLEPEKDRASLDEEKLFIEKQAEIAKQKEEQRQAEIVKQKQMEEDLKRQKMEEAQRQEEEQKKLEEAQRQEEEQKKLEEEQRQAETDKQKKKEIEEEQRREEEQRQAEIVRQKQIEEDEKQRQKKLEEAQALKDIEDAIQQEEKERLAKLQKALAKSQENFNLQFEEQLIDLQEQIRTIDEAQLLDKTTSQYWSNFKESFILSCTPKDIDTRTAIPITHTRFVDLSVLDYHQYRNIFKKIVKHTKKAILNFNLVVEETACGDPVPSQVARLQADLVQFYENFFIRLSNELHTRMSEFILPEGITVLYTQCSLDRAIRELENLGDGINEREKYLKETGYPKGLEWLNLLNSTENLIKSLSTAQDAPDSISKLRKDIEKIDLMKIDTLLLGLWSPEKVCESADECIGGIEQAIHNLEIIVDMDLEIEKLEGGDDVILSAFRKIESCHKVVVALSYTRSDITFNTAKTGNWTGLLDCLIMVKRALLADLRSYKSKYLEIFKNRSETKEHLIKLLEEAKNDTMALAYSMSIISDIETGKFSVMWDTIGELEPKLQNLIELAFVMSYVYIETQDFHDDYVNLCGRLKDGHTLNEQQYNLWCIYNPDYKYTDYNDKATRLTDKLMNSFNRILLGFSDENITQDLFNQMGSAKDFFDYLICIRNFLENITDIDQKVLKFNDSINLWVDSLQTEIIDDYLDKGKCQRKTFFLYTNHLNDYSNLKEAVGIEHKHLGDYVLTEEIGQGSEGIVFSGYHRTSKKKMAIKCPNVSFDDGDELETSGVCEVIASYLFDHPNILKLHDFCVVDKSVLSVFELLKAREFADLIVFGEFFSEERARNIFRQIVSAVDYMHCNGVAHRDIKDANILIDESDHVTLIDLGFSECHDGSTKVNSFPGTLSYGSPEITQSIRHLATENDVWTLGVLLFQMTTGYLPFDYVEKDAAYKKIEQGHFVFPLKLSEELTDLIQQILVPAKSRISLKQVTESKWFKQHSGEYNNHVKQRHGPYKVDETAINLLDEVMKLDSKYDHKSTNLKDLDNCTEDSDLLKKPKTKLYFLLQDKLSQSSLSIKPFTLKPDEGTKNDRLYICFILEAFVKMTKGIELSEELKKMLHLTER